MTEQKAQGSTPEPMQKVITEWRIVYEDDNEFYGIHEDAARADYKTALRNPSKDEYAGATLQSRRVVVRRQHDYWKDAEQRG